MPKKLVYYFGGKKADGKASMKPLLGGKGANLAEMVNLKLPVPPGFTITTDVCKYYYRNSRKYPKELKKQVRAALASVEKEIGSKFGDKKNPVHAVAGVSFTAPDGKITGLLGPNGAGKTTTMRMLYTLMAPDLGRVLVDGFDAVRQATEVRKRLEEASDYLGRLARNAPKGGD